MSVKLLDNKNKPNNTRLFKKCNYVSFNSSTPFHYNPFVYKIKDIICLERGIIEEVKNGKVVISYRDRTYDRKADQVKLISQTHLCLGWVEEPRVLWYGSEGCSEGYILHFDSKGRHAGYIKPKATPVINPKVLQHQQFLQHKIIPTLNTPSTITN